MGHTVAQVAVFLLHHPVVVAVVAGWGGVLYGWNQLRQRYTRHGRPLPPLGNILTRLGRFAAVEDRGPVFTRPAPVARWTGWYQWRRHYLLCVALAVASRWVALPGGPLPYLLAGGLPLAVRARRVFRIRWAVVKQMFDVAAAECRYPRDAALAPWNYIQIRRWETATTPGETAVMFPAAYQSEDQQTRQKFERQFNGTVSDEHSWRYQWQSSKNRVICAPIPYLPTLAAYPGPGPQWDKFRLGVAEGGREAVWDVSTYPHVLLAGPTGVGKSTLQRTILFHALVHADTWRIVGVDPKRVEMGWLRKYPNVPRIALNLEDGVQAVQDVRDEMMRRYEEMETAGVNHFQKLRIPPPAVLLMIDETYNFLAPEGIKSEEGKERDALHARATTMLGEIARLGRAAGVHLALATQRPDAKVIPGELKANCDARIAAGRMDTTPSLMVLDDEAATRLPKIKGRGLLRLGAEMLEYQGYLAEQDWFDHYQQTGPAGPPAAGADPGAPPRRRAGTLTQLSRLVPAGLLTRITGWVQRRRDVAAANEAALAAGRTSPRRTGRTGRTGRQKPTEPAVNRPPAARPALSDPSPTAPAPATPATPADLGPPADLGTPGVDLFGDLDLLPDLDDLTPAGQPAGTPADPTNPAGSPVPAGRPAARAAGRLPGRPVLPAAPTRPAPPVRPGQGLPALQPRPPSPPAGPAGEE